MNGHKGPDEGLPGDSAGSGLGSKSGSRSGRVAVDLDMDVDVGAAGDVVVDETKGTVERASEAHALPGAAEPRQDDAQPLDDEEIEIIGDLGSEFDDPEGWMSERPNYWTDFTDPPLPTRASLLRHRIGEFITLLRSFLPHRAPAWPAERVAETVWHRAVEEVFGPQSSSFPSIEPKAVPRGASWISPSSVEQQSHFSGGMRGHADGGDGPLGMACSAASAVDSDAPTDPDSIAGLADTSANSTAGKSRPAPR